MIYYGKTLFGCGPKLTAVQTRNQKIMMDYCCVNILVLAYL